LPAAACSPPLPLLVLLPLYSKCVQLQVDAMGQENSLLRRILIAHAKEMTEAENVSDNICTLAGDLLQLLTHGQLAGKQPNLDASRD